MSKILTNVAETPSISEPSIRSSCSFFFKFASITVAVIGVMVLIGWWQDIAMLKSVLPNLVTMKANTACSFVLLGLSIYFIGEVSEGRDSHFRRRIGFLLPMCAGAFGFLTGVEYIFEVNLGIDELLFIDRNGDKHGINPGRMAPATALGFVLCSSALLLLRLKSNTAHLCGHALAFMPGLIGFLAILGYIYGVESLYRVKLFTSVAIHTALLFFLSCLAIFAATTTRGVMPTLVANDIVGGMLRRMLPAAILLPPLLGWLRLLGQNAGYYSTNFGLALFASANVLVFLLLIALTARSLKTLSNRIHALNMNLEVQVQQRTEELNVALKENQGLLDTLNKQILYSATVLKATTEVSIIATNVNGMIELFNVGAERMLGYSAEEMVNKCSPAILHNLDEMAIRGQELTREYGTPIEGFRVFAHKPELFGAETRNWTYVRKDGSAITVSLSVTAIRDGKNQVIGYLGVAIDVTQQYILENELRNAKQQADLASTTKSHFLANMSHEIRTPMNAVLGMLQLVQHTDLSARQIDYISKAETAAKSLLGLLNDILDFSKIEAGKLELDPHPFEIEGLMRDLAVVLSGNHGEKDVEIMFDITPRLPRLLIGDRLRLQQILTNLASNALKFTNSGHVLVSASKVTQTQTDITLNFSVADTGIGISTEQQTRIFEGFVQAEASTTRRFGGTGLGLVISKRLTNMMGGELLLDSEIGKGSRFSFEITLPIADSAPVDGIPNIAGSSLSDIKLLVVDDNPLVLEVLVHTLASLGFKVNQANGGFAAVEQVRKAEQRGMGYDVVLMDWRMPDMDGLSAAQLIRTASKNNHPPVVIMVTAHEREVLVRQDDSSVPYAELLTKPVTPQQLANSIWQSFKKLDPIQDIHKIIEHKLPLKGINLLVVEDNELNRQVAQELLTNAGAYVELAYGGIEGVEKVTMGSHLYDLVLMDVQMPDIDGYEATRRIRAEQRFQYLPILAMTANASVSDKEACMAAGMNGHVGKPIDMEQLVANILQLLGRESLASPLSAEATSDEDVIIDQHQVILKRFGGNQNLFARMLTNFRPEIMRLMVALELSCKHQNESGIKAALHSMRGVAATMGARALAKMAGELEQSCNGKSIHEIELLVDDLVRNELMQLFELSDKLLAKLVSETHQPEEERELKSLSSAEWQSRLFEIMQLLETDNLAAIDKVEALLLTVKNHEKLNQLLAEVNALNYGQAMETLNAIIKESSL